MTEHTSALDALLANGEAILVAGPGGVGKTTVSAALAVRAAQHHGRRVLLVTVDPARRLADALGVEEVSQLTTPEPVLVPVGPGDGRLWAVMVDMASSWDALVTRFAEDPADRDALFDNSLYRTLTTRFVQSHDYIALDHLCELTDDERYDLVIVDTPPSGHALDILDAPGRMLEFFDSRLLRWLTASYRTRLAAVTARPFLAVAERLLGGQFLSDVAEFFWLLSRLQPGLVARSQQVQATLDDPATHVALVTSAETPALAQTDALRAALVDRGRAPALLVHNRASSARADVAIDDVVDPSLRAAVEAVVGSARSLTGWWADRDGQPDTLITVPRRWDSVHSVSALGTLFDDGSQVSQ
ncbi:MAG: ArsA family ATPase [Actinomycetota bacterium]